MPPRTLLLLRPQAMRLVPLRPAAARPLLLRRAYSVPRDSIPPPPPPKGPTQDPLPHVSEEAAAMAKITGETPPEIEQGTPIDEVISRDAEAQEKAPGVLKPAATPGQKRSYSTAAAAPAAVPSATDVLASMAAPLPAGAKYPLPTLPLPPNTRLHERYSPLLTQFTNILMEDGKKGQAERVVAAILQHLRSKPAPTHNPRTPIIPSAPPLESLPRNPIAYLQTAIDSLAPLMRLKSIKGSGGFKEILPMPLGMKQRRRKAITWILDASAKRKTRLGLAERVAEEVVAVVEGRSGAWDKRTLLHKQATQARANVKVKA